MNTPNNFFPATGANFPNAQAFSTADVASPRPFDYDDRSSTPADFKAAIDRISADSEVERMTQARGSRVVVIAKHVGNKLLQKGLPLVVSGVAALSVGNAITSDADTEKDSLHTVPVAITNGMGSREVVDMVDPKIVDEAWKSEESLQKLEDLEKYVEDQSATNNGVLQAGQTVNVPFIDGQQYNDQP